MSKAATGARYLIVLAAALAARQVVNARQQRRRDLGGASPDHWADAVRAPQPPPGDGPRPAGS